MKNQRLLPLLVLMAAMTALSMDIYLPSMASLVTALNTSQESVGLSLSAFVFAFAFGQLFYGPLSDRFGRKVPLLGGLVLYLGANLICTLAQSIEVLIIGRALEGLGACAGTVLCSAIVRDVYKGEARTRAMASVASCVALAPITAPLIGAYLHNHFGWRASFVFLSLFALALLLIVVKLLPETNHERTQQLDLKAYPEVVRQPQWRAWTMVNICSFSALFAFIGTSATLLVGEMGLSPQTYGWLFSSNALAYMLGSGIASRVKLPSSTLALWGCLQIIVGGLIMLLLPTLGISGPMAVLGPMYLVTSGVGLSMPAGAAGALEPFPKIAGSAAALQGFLRFALAALVIYVTNLWPNSGAYPLAGAILGSGILALIGLWAVLQGVPEQESEWPELQPQELG